MGFFFTTSKTRQETSIQRQKDEGVTGSYQRRFTFTFKHEHLITPGYAVKHLITGVFDSGLERDDQQTGDQVWSIAFRNLSFDWNPDAIPEYYYLFAYPSRMDIRIDRKGQLIAGQTWVNYREHWKKRYKKDISEHIQDEERAMNLYDTIYHGKREKHQLALQLLKSNPLITALGRQVKLNYNLNHTSEPAGEFGERFAGEILLNDYFSDGIHLPLKTTWLKRQVNDSIEEWVHLGGLIKEKYQEYELRRQLRLITGVPNLEVPMHVEFSELFHMDRKKEGFQQIDYGLLQTETFVKDAWMKSEELEIITDKNGVVYGNE